LVPEYRAKTGHSGVLAMARSFRPLRFAAVVVVVAVVSLSLTGCVADPPPQIGAATGGDQAARVSWQPPLAVREGFPITAYVLTPWVGQAAQPSIRFNSTATTQTLTGLTNGTTYTFTVVAINGLGDASASSGSSNPVTPAVGPLSDVAGGSVAAQSYDNRGDCSGNWYQFFDDSYPGGGAVGTVTFHLEGCTHVSGLNFTGGTFTISTSIGSVSGTASGPLRLFCLPSPNCPLIYDLTLIVMSGTDAFADTAGTLHAHIEWDGSTESPDADLQVTVP
jgi:hypothetical protein